MSTCPRLRHYVSFECVPSGVPGPEELQKRRPVYIRVPGSGVGFALCEGTLFKLKSLFFLMSTSSICLCQYITYLWTTYPLKCFLLCTGKCSCRPGMQEQNDSWEEAQDTEEKKEGDRVQAQFTEE